MDALDTPRKVVDAERYRRVLKLWVRLITLYGMNDPRHRDNRGIYAPVTRWLSARVPDKVPAVPLSAYDA